MPMRYEIEPGYGNRGIAAARDLLVERCRAAAVEAVGHADKIKIRRSDCGGFPYLGIQFDANTTLTIRFWQHDALWGFEPWIHMDTTRHFYWTIATNKQPRPYNWNSEVELIVDAIQRVLVTVKLVEIP
jgi:hypothetical protein